MPQENLEEVIRKYPRGGIEVFVEQFDLSSSLDEQVDQYDRSRGFQYGDSLLGK